MRIEDVLQDVDEWCGFTRAFQPLGGYTPRDKDPYRSLLATLIAHGTNLGLAAMSQSVDDLTAEMLQDTSRWFLRDATLKAANTVLVDYHHSLPLSRVWGDGSRSSSDGQRFMVQRDSLLGSVYPRYFGYYDRALALYTHTADQHSVYGTQVIAVYHAKRAMCWAAFSTMTPCCRSGSTPPTRMASPSISSACAPCWASGSCRG